MPKHKWQKQFHYVNETKMIFLCVAESTGLFYFKKKLWINVIFPHMRIEYVAGKIEINRVPSHPLKTKNRSISHHHQFHRISKSNMKYQYISDSTHSY